MKGRMLVERILRIPAKDLDRVRINCRQCGDVFAELPISGLVNGVLLCPGCRQDPRKRPNVDNDLKQFANGLMALQSQMEIGVEFMLAENIHSAED